MSIDMIKYYREGGDLPLSQYYDGTKLLSMKDINGKRPELYLCVTNRSGGKTVWFNRYCVNSWKRGKGKFILVYRYNYELDDVADKFYKDISPLFFNGSVMTSKRKAAGIYHELFIDDESCGYALSLNSADQIKKYAHLFSDANRMLFDEFQSETNHYCSDEVTKFISVHTSVARGHGEQVRYVPVYMLSNPVSIINPYYTELGISSRLNEETKFLRGDGFVMEQGYVDAASRAQKDSGFNRAFSGNSYIAYSTENVYLNDNNAFIEKPTGKSRYLATLRYKGTDFAIREYADSGIIYCDDKCDSTNNYRITVSADDHRINYVMLRANDLFLANMKYYFERGCFRFKDLRCKEAILTALSY